jgi:hypothetical protein
MKSEDLERFTQSTPGDEERASRVAGARTGAAGASEQCSDLTRGNDPATGNDGRVGGEPSASSAFGREMPAGESRERAPAAASSPDPEGAWAPEPNIVPESERSQR